MSDEDDFSLSCSTVAIIGLGLMGGSLAMALKGKCADVLAVLHHSSMREQELCQKIVSQADEDPAKILPQADVIILSTPSDIPFVGRGTYRSKMRKRTFTRMPHLF